MKTRLINLRDLMLGIAGWFVASNIVGLGVAAVSSTIFVELLPRGPIQSLYYPTLESALLLFVWLPTILAIYRFFSNKLKMLATGVLVAAIFDQGLLFLLFKTNPFAPSSWLVLLTPVPLFFGLIFGGYGR